MRTNTVLGVATAVAASTLLITAVTGPASAADASKIVYESGGHIWIMDGDGTNQVDLMNGWTGLFATNPALSPDATTVAYQAGTSTAQEIYTIPATGAAQANAVRLTTNTVLDGDPAWSPDGTKIAFTRDQPTNSVPRNYEIFVMDANGTNSTRIAGDTIGGYDTTPTWSPDGTKIAYTSTNDNFGCYDEGVGQFIGFSQIYVVSSTGGTGTNLIDQNTLTASDPDWSPDGTQIAFYGDQYNAFGPDTGQGPTCQGSIGNRIYTMPSTGSNSPDVRTAGTWPSWSPDGSQIAYSTYPGQLLVAYGSGVNTSLNATGRYADWVLPVTRTATSITLKITSGATNLKAAGAVAPNLAGQSVKVVLYRQSSGVFSKVASKTATLSSLSKYSASFPHPQTGTCKIKATYAGDATHLPSSKSKQTPC